MIERNNDIIALPKVLVAEDDRCAAQMIRHMLSKEFDVEHVDNGYDAVQRCLAGQYLALILDVGLPQRDGFEVIRILRAQSGLTATIPIIVQSAHCDKADHRQLLALGANAVFTKPVQRRSLTLSIYQWHTKRTAHLMRR